MKSFERWYIRVLSEQLSKESSRQQFWSKAIAVGDEEWLKATANKFSAHVQPISAASDGVLRLNSTPYGRPQKIPTRTLPKGRGIKPSLINSFCCLVSACSKSTALFRPLLIIFL
ncbi:MAG: hypothetical protein L3K26_12500, partial [Candidatus Hydrogenedentes bacterium]|nr:hypothetical protein [Candidatus Hydrogenedentota bacterium]